MPFLPFFSFSFLSFDAFCACSIPFSTSSLPFSVSSSPFSFHVDFIFDTALLTISEDVNSDSRLFEMSSISFASSLFIRSPITFFPSSISYESDAMRGAVRTFWVCLSFLTVSNASMPFFDSSLSFSSSKRAFICSCISGLSVICFTVLPRRNPTHSAVYAARRSPSEAQRPSGGECLQTPCFPQPNRISQERQLPERSTPLFCLQGVY